MLGTYRLQLGPELDFARARALVPYLRGLGVSHLYLSPVLQAREGSTHGYDVIDPTRVSDDLGGEEGLRALAGEGLGLILDIVPNHMAASDENPFWRDPERRTRFFDVDPATCRHRRFFDVDELAGVRQEDEEVFETTHRLVLRLVAEGIADGLRIDHVDGLADPAGYLRLLNARGAERVWVEKILEPGERLRDWRVEGTTGYEFANDSTAVFVDPAAEERLTRLYQEITGERRDFHEIAEEAKREQAATTFEPEVERLRRVADLPGIEEALAALPVYRTYVEPWSGEVDQADRDALRDVPAELRAALLLEADAPGELVTRFQQTSGAVMAKGVEDTAFYRFARLLALNEVGGNPGRFALPVADLHAANLERDGRFPRHLLAGTTHDTKRSADVRARLAAISWVAERWEQLVRSLGVRGEEDYLALQTVVGAWPIEPERTNAYLEKALREGKRISSWLDPDEEAERHVQRRARDFLGSADVAGFVELVRPLGERISLGMTLLRATAPGVPDTYGGDELELLALVDPDNRRPVDWDARRRALADPPPKLRVLREALALRARRPEAFARGYEPVEAGDGVVAYRRGPVLVAVPLRADAAFEPPTGATNLLGELPVWLSEA